MDALPTQPSGHLSVDSVLADFVLVDTVLVDSMTSYSWKVAVLTIPMKVKMSHALMEIAYILS